VIVVLSDGDDNFSEQIRELRSRSTSAYNGKQTRRERGPVYRTHQRAVAAVQKSVQQADVIFYSVNPVVLQ
jgi:hypothetical protein